MCSLQLPQTIHCVAADLLRSISCFFPTDVTEFQCTVAILCAGDVEDCLVQPLPQGQFTPLPEALCWVILDLTSSGQAAVLERIRSALHVAFPDIQRPSQEIVYDALAKLMAERKVKLLEQVFFSYQISLAVFWVVTSYGLVRGHRRFGEHTVVVEPQSRLLIQRIKLIQYYFHYELHCLYTIRS
jgi:hypothetical protein